MTSNQPWWLTMPVRELAATILPLLSSSTYIGEQRAIQVIEHAGLLMRGFGSTASDGPVVGLTRLGRDALATNTVRQHLGISDAAPTT